MHFIAFKGRAAVYKATAYGFEHFIADEDRINVEEIEAARLSGRTFNPIWIRNPVPQHLIATTHAQYSSAAANVSGQIDIPALGTQETKVSYGGLRARQNDQIGVARKWLSRWNEGEIHCFLGSKRIEFVEIGD